MSGRQPPRLIILNAAQVITPIFQDSGSVSNSTLRVIPDGAVLVEDGTILAVGTTEALRADSRSQGADPLDASHCVVAPGFVDSHTHLVFAATRQEEYEMRLEGASYESIAAAGGGIRNSVRRLREVTEDDLFKMARQRCSQFLDYGTTTIEAKSGYGLDLENELKILRVLTRLNGDPRVALEIVPTFLGAHEIPDEFRDHPSKYVDLVCEAMIPRVVRERLADFCDVFCESGVFTVEQSRRILTAAQRYGLKIKLHADQLSRSGGTRLAVELGAVSADHLEQIDEEDITLLAKSKVVATLLPGASFHLGMTRFAPARKLLDGGACVALASDFNPGTSPTVNMQTILAIACSSLRMTPAETFAAATLGGARALASAERLGSLQAGKQADLVLFNVNDYRLVPYYYGMNMVRAVIKKGRVLFDRRNAWGEETL
ncbi:MAG: imidazolonepropionase [Terriglobia bacterium]